MASDYIVIYYIIGSNVIFGMADKTIAKPVNERGNEILSAVEKPPSAFLEMMS